MIVDKYSLYTIVYGLVVFVIVYTLKVIRPQQLIVGCLNIALYYCYAIWWLDIEQIF